MQENWKPIVGYEELYEVSDHGRVRRADTGRVNKLCLAPTGYHVVSLWARNVGKTCGVHRLVAQAFIGPLSLGECVNHLDGNKTNNHVSNLAYCSLAENNTHARKSGLWRSPSKINPDLAEEIYRRAWAGERTNDLAAEFGVLKQVISQIKHKGKWRRDKHAPAA